MENWVIKELESLNVGDIRLEKRIKHVLSVLSRSPKESIPVSCRTWSETKAAYRCFSSDKISADKIMAPHKKNIIERTKQFKRALALQDTTELNYSGQKKKQGVGPRRHENERDLFIHPQLVISDSGICLGVYDDYQWFRKELKTQKQSRKEITNDSLHRKHISEKETGRWIEGYKKATELARSCPDTQIISVSDREGYIYDLFESAENESGIKADWLVRMKSINRAILNSSGKRDSLLLNEKMMQILPQQIIEFTLPEGRGQPSRKVQQELRLARLTLHPPTGRRGKLRCSPVTVTVLLAKEINAPESVQPLVWWLMSSVPPEKLTEPAQLIQWYLLRWQIEVFFKVLKSGCQVEKLQLETFERTRNCLALYLIISWRILYLSSLYKMVPEEPCDLIFEKKEYEYLWILVENTPPPENIPNIRTAVLMLARLGGYLARKNDSPPGPKTIWSGLTQLMLSINAIEIAQKTCG
ncbi:TPA: IS4 family transposase [Escherichia coli]|nr:IS4 family transposase [Escherichia coli]